MKMLPQEQTDYPKHFDVIVVGAGHAGCEAALASARMGLRTAVFTYRIDKIGLMPCNPAVGGIGKGHLVKEIDALGGVMGSITDQARIQMKVLNRKKGPAVRAPRAQADKKLYEIAMRNELFSQPDLFVIEDGIDELVVRNGKIEGVVTSSRRKFECTALVIAAGTFLKGNIVIGKNKSPAGRMGERPSLKLSESLVKHGLNLGRFQSATPPRVHKRSVDITNMIPQPGDNEEVGFSHFKKYRNRDQVPCYLTYTNKRTQDIVNKYLHLSPIRSGAVKTKGPRNCPSIERKIINFPDKDSHPVFIEPEGFDTAEMYLQGLTTSMPVEIQAEIIRSTPGLEKAEIMRPGYAVEYDYLPPDQLNASLGSKLLDGLFTAGQINGTTGYEEAAAQGLMAGINAAKYVRGESPLILDRSQAYIGVLIDDLVTKGVDEPYRMFTSRAEYRLHLRSDNADARLSHIGHSLGLVSDTEMEQVSSKNARATQLRDELQKSRISGAQLVDKTGIKMAPHVSISLAELLRRPEVRVADLVECGLIPSGVPEDVQARVEADIKYEGYVARQSIDAQKMKNLDNIKIPKAVDFESMPNLSFQAKEKLSAVRPISVGQAARIPGITPSDVTTLSFYVSAQRKQEDRSQVGS